MTKEWVESANKRLETERAKKQSTPKGKGK